MCMELGCVCFVCVNEQVWPELKGFQTNGQNLPFTYKIKEPIDPIRLPQ